jgi:hypothetical protein
VTERTETLHGADGYRRLTLLPEIASLTSRVPAKGSDPLAILICEKLMVHNTLAFGIVQECFE